MSTWREKTSEVPPSRAEREMLKLSSPTNADVSLKVKEIDKVLLPPTAMASLRGHSINVPLSTRALQVVVYIRTRCTENILLVKSVHKF